MKALRLFLALFIATTLLAQDVEVQPQATIINSSTFQLIGHDDHNQLIFTGNVRIATPGLSATCDNMEVITSRDGEKEATIGSLGAAKKIIAMGKVHIVQAGREAKAGRAEIFPSEGKIVLTENPIVTDQEGTMTGYRMTLFKGKRQALIEGELTKQVEITLPVTSDLGFSGEEDNDDEAATATEATSEKQTDENSQPKF